MFELDPHLLAACGGVLGMSQLRAMGATQTRIRQLVATGDLTRVRRGWFATPSSDDTVRRAVAAGGALSCVSALAWYGAWRPPRSEPHIRLAKAARRVPAGIIQHTIPQRLGTRPVAAAIDGPALSAACALTCAAHLDTIPTLDSAVRLNLVDADHLHEIAAALGPGARRRAALVDPTSESGTESIVRLRLRSLRLRVRPQVSIAGVGRVDFLIGDRLILEVDSRAHHTGEQSYQSDRDRDRELHRRGYIVLRVTYADVHHRWSSVEPAILDLVRRDAHCWPRRVRNTLQDAP